MNRSRFSQALGTFRRYHSLLGARGVALWPYAKLFKRHPLVRKSALCTRHPVYLRIGTTDLTVYRQVFIERQYEHSLPISPKVIVDAGANIGLSAVFFANKYPDSLVFAVEPSP